MKLLKDILYKAGIDEVVGNTHLAVETICFDSRLAEKMSAFCGYSWHTNRWPLIY